MEFFEGKTQDQMTLVNSVFFILHCTEKQNVHNILLCECLSVSNKYLINNVVDFVETFRKLK